MGRGKKKVAKRFISYKSAIIIFIILSLVLGIIVLLVQKERREAPLSSPTESVCTPGQEGCAGEFPKVCASSGQWVVSPGKVPGKCGYNEEDKNLPFVCTTNTDCEDEYGDNYICNDLGRCQLQSGSSLWTIVIIVVFLIIIILAIIIFIIIKKQNKKQNQEPFRPIVRGPRPPPHLQSVQRSGQRGVGELPLGNQ